MRAGVALASAFSAGIIQAAAQEAFVYTFGDSQTPPNNIANLPVIAPETARLVLAQRLGVSQYHSLGTTGDSTLDLVAQLGGAHNVLFKDDKADDEIRRVLVIVEGIESPESIFGRDMSPTFKISNPPPSSSNRQLVLDFLAQDRHRRGSLHQCSPGTLQSKIMAGGYSANDPVGSCNFQKSSAGVIKNEAISEDLACLAHIARGELGEYNIQDSMTIVHISALTDIIRQDNTVSEDYAEAFNALSKVLSALVRQIQGQETTVVLIPRASKHPKRIENAYGSYTMPGRIHKIREQPEEPLSLAPQSIPLSSSPKLQPSQPQTLKASSLPLAPLCYSVEGDCLSSTGNCSGHGSCYNKISAPESSAGGDCWLCGCQPTVVKNEKGQNKTTAWGGPACSKKDVSAPFFLLAGFTIVMVATLSWGIGLLYSIGEEELPSVIGAGVTGPRA